MNDPTGTPEETAKAEPTFDDLPLSPEIKRALEAMGYRHPTPVQRAVFEPAAEGRSLVVQARTGTGKTTAFGLPLVDRLVRASAKGVQAMVLCPTRELALQVGREIERLGQFRGITTAAIYGGASMSKQVEAIAAGAQIVVGTPGRVLDHLRQKTLDPSNLRVLVLDEADEMLSMGFARELNAILEALPKNRQGLFFSATLPPDIERLAHNHLRDPEVITLSSDQVGALEIAHYVYVLRGGDKLTTLIRILEVEDPESAIIFCNTRDETQRVAEALKNRGFDADWLNGDLPQNDRERVMSATRAGRLRFLVATDVAARGIDISHLTHVINHDFPDTAEQYVHRTGRTGRAGRTGTAIAIVGPKDIGNLYLLRLTFKIRPIEKQLPSAGELKTRAERDVLQLFVDAFAQRVAHDDDLSLARRLLTHEDAEPIIAGLLRDHLGARGGDAATEAAEARRARNPTETATRAPEAAAKTPERAAKTPERSVEAHATSATPVGEVALAQAPSRSEARENAEPVRARSADRAVSADRTASGIRTRGDRPGARRRETGSRTRDAEPRLPPEGAWEPPAEADDDEPILNRPADDDSRLPKITVSDTRAFEAADDGFVQVFVNVGTREGVRTPDLQKLLATQGIAPEDTNGIRVRDRMTFIGVRKPLLERTVAALSGQVIGGRTVVAELARVR